MKMLVKSLLLATPAMIIAAGVGQAADLPAMKAAPIQYVRVCDAYGSGFFYIPGTDTCLRVGGYFRFETRYVPGHAINNPLATTRAGATSQISQSQDTTGMQVRGRIDLDARTQTAWGTVQTVARLRGTNQDGVYSTTSAKLWSTSDAPTGNGTTTVTMERAYVRFAGLTAGVSSENFSTMPSYMYGSTVYAGFPNGVKQLTYTATFGGGFSGTISIESKGDQMSNVNAGTTNVFSTADTGGIPAGYGTIYANRPDSGYSLIGNLRYDANWGYFQVNAATQRNTYNAFDNTPNYNALDGQTGKTGWAAGFSFRYNLPFIAPGDQFHFQAAYAHGMNGMIESSGLLNNLSNSSGTARWLGGIQTPVSNLIATSATCAVAPPVGTAKPVATCGVDSVGEVNSWQIFGLYTHYWAPQWRSNVTAGYMGVEAPTAAASAGLQEGDARLFQTGANLVWSPTKNFDIGVELDYMHLSQTLQNVNVKTGAANGTTGAGAGWIAAGEPGLKSNGVQGILRIEREF